MTQRKIKEFANGLLVIVAVEFGIFVNQADDSTSFYTDFLEVKSIALIAVLLLVYINRNSKKVPIRQFALKEFY